MNGIELAGTADIEEIMKSKIQTIMTSKLQPNDYNPNRMTEGEFAEFVDEVRHLGRLPKPVVVRPGDNGEFVIIDGEHAWKASQEVGLKKIDCEVMEADDFESMRQTYKRNQHGTHNKILLGRMFQRMAKERNLSLRKLAKEIEVSEGTIRNAFEYTRAVKVRNTYAPDGDSEAEVAALSIKQARLFNRLPKTIANLWLDSGADIKAIIGESKDLKSHIYDYACHTEGELMTENEYLDYVYGAYERCNLLQYVEREKTFDDALKQVKDWLKWERKYFRWGTELDADCRKTFRKYAHYYYEGIWPFNDNIGHWMDNALNLILNTDRTFQITPEEFGGVVKQMEEYALKHKRHITREDFQDFFKLVIYEKTGKKIPTERNIQVEMRELELKDAPDYIQQSTLQFSNDKYELWKIAEETQAGNPDQKDAIENAAKHLAKERFLYGRSAIMERLNSEVLVDKEVNRRATLSDMELAMEIAANLYPLEKYPDDKKESAKEAHRTLASKLSTLTTDELEVFHSRLKYNSFVAEMRVIVGKNDAIAKAARRLEC